MELTCVCRCNQIDIGFIAFSEYLIPRLEINGAAVPTVGARVACLALLPGYGDRRIDPQYAHDEFEYSTEALAYFVKTNYRVFPITLD
jgi:hypothetical protein